MILSSGCISVSPICPYDYIGRGNFSRFYVCAPRPDRALKRFSRTMTLISGAVKKGALDIIRIVHFSPLSSLLSPLSMPMISCYHFDIMISGSQFVRVI